MQGLRQLLASSLLLAAIFGVLADKTDEHVSQLRKRSADPLPDLVAEDNNDSWDEETSPEAQKRFSEFVGKRSPYEFLGKRGYEFLGKRGYEFLGKRSPYEFVGKRSPYEFLGKRNPYEFLGKRSPYEFLGKRSPYEFLGKRKRLYDFLGKRVQLPYEFVGKRVFGKLWEETTTGAAAARILAPEESEMESALGDRVKRYSEWIGKRDPQYHISTEQLVRQLMNKRISAMVLRRVHESKPEFIGRREESDDEPEADKRYAEFIGRK